MEKNYTGPSIGGAEKWKNSSKNEQNWNILKSQYKHIEATFPELLQFYTIEHRQITWK